MHKLIFAGVLAFASGLAGAQAPAKPDPSDPGVPIPKQSHDSVFKDFRPYADPAPRSWRDSNAEAGRLGGHMGHVPRPGGVQSKPAAQEPRTGGHGGHK